MKQLPNFFTLLNLIFGCISIVLILQTGETIVVMDDGGGTQVTLPEKIWWGALFIFAAAVVDFFDGFLARLLKANSVMGGCFIFDFWSGQIKHISFSSLV